MHGVGTLASPSGKRCQIDLYVALSACDWRAQYHNCPRRWFTFTGQWRDGMGCTDITVAGKLQVDSASVTNADATTEI